MSDAPAEIADPRLPYGFAKRSGLAVIGEREQWWKPNPRLNVGAADSFSLCAVTSVASRSMIT